MCHGTADRGTKWKFVFQPLESEASGSLWLAQNALGFGSVDHNGGMSPALPTCRYVCSQNRGFGFNPVSDSRGNEC